VDLKFLQFFGTLVQELQIQNRTRGQFRAAARRSRPSAKRAWKIAQQTHSAPWIDAVTIPTADRNPGIDPRQNRPGHRVRLIENAGPVLVCRR
jgi:hypothetical protein